MTKTKRANQTGIHMRLIAGPIDRSRSPSGGPKNEFASSVATGRRVVTLAVFNPTAEPVVRSLATRETGDVEALVFLPR
jgi:hypothetical protein